MKKKKTKFTVRVLAERTAESLFTNISGQQASRLILENPGKPLGRDGYSWCQSAVADVIEKALRKVKE